jgi:hypothetical protein
VHRSLLGRIARYGISGVRDAREDRLTEIAAGVFAAEQCADVARHVALGWLEAAVEMVGESPAHQGLARMRGLLGDETARWSCSASTQIPFRTTEGWRRPDLELRSDSATRSEVVVLWIEVKHGTSPHTRQLEAYAAEQGRRSVDNAAVLLVAPRADYTWFDATEIPPEVPRLTWEQTAERLSSYAPADPVGRFLVGDLLAYLDEEGLMDPDRLSANHVTALVEHRTAFAALLRICEIAARVVDERWNDLVDASTWPATRPHEYWWTYQPGPRSGASPSDSGLDWNWQLLPDSAYLFKDGRSGVPCLLTGVAGKQGSTVDLGTSARGRLREAGFQVLGPGETNSRNWDYIVRRAYPDDQSDVLAGADLTSQGTALGGWIEQGFRDAHHALAVTWKGPSVAGEG